jgi:hypothetical protein
MSKGLGLGPTFSTGYIYVLVGPCQYRSRSKCIGPEFKGTDVPTWLEQLVVREPYVASLVP